MQAAIRAGRRIVLRISSSFGDLDFRRRGHCASKPAPPPSLTGPSWYVVAGGWQRRIRCRGINGGFDPRSGKERRPDGGVARATPRAGTTRSRSAWARSSPSDTAVRAPLLVDENCQVSGHQREEVLGAVHVVGRPIDVLGQLHLEAALDAVAAEEPHL